MVRRLAKSNPDVLVIGVDANGDNLRAVSRRVSRRPARGGVANAVFGRLSLEDSPGNLVGLADDLTVYFPWGSLLEAIARPEPKGLVGLRDLCKPGARVCIVFGYHLAADQGWISELGLPSLDQRSSLEMLERRYREVDFAVAARHLTVDEVRELPTTWAQKLAFARRERLFVELSGEATSQ